MDAITEALSTLQITLLNIALDDFEEPYTREERYEVLIKVVTAISDLVEDVGGGKALNEAYRQMKINLLIRGTF